MTDEELEAWWPALGIIVAELRSIGEVATADSLVEAVSSASSSSEILGEVGAILRRNPPLQSRLGPAATSAWRQVMQDVDRAFPGARFGRIWHGPPPSGRANIWIKALLCLPLPIAGLFLLTDQLTILDFETLTGGESGFLLWIMRLAAFVAAVAYATFGLLLYCVLFLYPLADLVMNLRKQVSVFIGATLGAIALLMGMENFVAGQLAEAQLTVEHIHPEDWHIETCSRGTAACLYWHGSLGRAGVKSQLGSRDAADAVVAQWRDASDRGAELQVIWGKTPAGWIAVRSARAGQRNLYNHWRSAQKQQ